MNGNSETPVGNLESDAMNPETLRTRAVRLVRVGILIAAIGYPLIAIVKGKALVEIAQLDGKPLQIEFAGGRLFLLDEGPSGNARRILMYRRPGRTPRTLCRGAGISRFATDGKWVYFLEFTAGTLNRLRVRTGNAETLVSGLVNPGDIILDRRRVAWTETHDHSVTGIHTVPALMPLTTLRVMERKSRPVQPRVLAAFETDSRQFNGELAALDNRRIAWLTIPMVAPTLSRGNLYTRALKGGELRTVSKDSGLQSAAARGTRVYWSAVCDEAANPASFATVYCTDTRKGSPSIFADWLPPAGKLFSVGRRIYYVSPTAAFRLLGDRRVTQVAEMKGGVGGLACLTPHNIYCVEQYGDPQGPKYRAMRYPVSGFAWVRNAVGRL